MAEQLPIWQDLGVEPPALLKTNGWQPGMKPSAQHMNWLFNRIYKCLEEIQAGGGTEELEKELAELQLAFAEHLTAKSTVNEVGHVQLSNSITGNSQTKAGTELAIKDAKEAAIKFAKDVGIGVIGNVTTTSVNDLITNGMYAGFDLVGAPSTGYYSYFVDMFDSATGTQIAVNNANARIYFRTRTSGGGWGIWRQLIDSTMKNVPNGVIGLDANGQFPEGLMKGTLKKISTTNLTTGNVFSLANLGAYKKLRFILKDVKFTENAAGYIFLNVNDDTLGSITGSNLINGAVSNIGNTADIVLIRVDSGTGRMNGVLDIGGVVSKREVLFKSNSYAEGTAKNASQYNYDFTGYLHGAITSIDKVSFKTSNGVTFGAGTIELWGEL